MKGACKIHALIARRQSAFDLQVPMNLCQPYSINGIGRLASVQIRIENGQFRQPEVKGIAGVFIECEGQAILILQ